jgi:hypothetical protein
MLSNVDLEGLGETAEEKRRKIETISLGIQNAIRAGQGLPPLQQSWTDDFVGGDFKNNWPKWIAYGVIGYFGFKLAQEWIRKR